MKQDAERAGLPSGEYTVVVKPPVPEDIDAPQPQKFHSKYSGRTTTELAATVSEDAAPLELVLDPPE